MFFYIKIDCITPTEKKLQYIEKENGEYYYYWTWWTVSSII